VVDGRLTVHFKSFTFMTCKRELLVHNTVYYQADFLPMPSPFKITILTKTVFLLSYFLTVCSFANGQEVIYPANFVQPDIPTTTTDESSINAYALPLNDGFLFPICETLAFNLAGSGNYYSSAKLIKTDNSGNLTASFTVPYDSSVKRVFLPWQVMADSNRVYFITSMDSAVNNNFAINKAIIIYRLKSTDLSYIASDTFKDLFPLNTCLLNGSFVEAGNKGYASIVYFPADIASLGLHSELLKINLNSNGASIQKTFLDSMFTLKKDGMNFVTSMSWDKSMDSFDIFMRMTDSLTAQTLLKVIRFDTALTTMNLRDIPDFQYSYAPGRYLESTLTPQGLRYDDKIILGSFFPNESAGRTAGIIKYSLTEQAYKKALVIPDSINFSYTGKQTIVWGSLDRNNTNLFCATADATSPSELNTIENHIYVGKTDTAMNQWQWYKYIGKPSCYLVPDKLLATSDGGCLITADAYDFGSSVNLQHDIYIIKLDGNGFITHVTNLSNSDSRHLSVYPVPAQNEIFLSYNGDEPYDLVIYDITGKMAWQKTGLTKTSNRISISNLTPGNYFYQAHFKNGKTENGKIIKQ
jgi:hypothetical protein